MMTVHFTYNQCMGCGKSACTCTAQPTESAEIERLRAELARVTAERDALKQEAGIHAMEARTQRATVHEIYQVLTGSTGEPGTWHGAEPARKVMAELAEARRDAARYQWLRIQRSGVEVAILADDGETWYATDGNDLDAAIDAARRE